jgi:hypothetical protein
MLLMQRRWRPSGAVVIACCLALAGCQNSSQTPQPNPEERQIDVQTRLYERLRSGATQVEVCLSEIDAARNLVLELKSDLGGRTDALEALEDILGILDSVAAGIADFAEAPAESEVRTDFATQDDFRLKAIEALDTALFEIGDGDAIVLELKTYLPAETELRPAEIQNHIDNTRDSLKDGIRNLGGDPDAESLE